MKHLYANCTRHFKLLVCVFLALLVTYCNILAVELSVTRYTQEKDNWCWAASAQMIGKYKTGTKKSQSSIVTHVKGSAVNSGANTSEVQKAIKYTTGKGTVYVEGTIGFGELQGHIQNGDPLYLSIVWNSGGAHGVVCSGARTYSGVQQIRIVDPWYSCGVKYISYASAKNNGSFQSGTGSWVRTYSYY